MNRLMKDVIAYKNSLEKMIATSHSSPATSKVWMYLTGISRQKHRDYFPAINPRAFADNVFPFSKIHYSYDAMVPMEVNPEYVVGATYKNYSDSTLSDDFVLRRLNKFTDEYIETGKLHFELARYCKIGNFPIYVALEGKNRVSLFRRHGKSIKAMVTQTAYPSPSDLLITKIMPFGVCYMSCSDPNFNYRGTDLETRTIAFPMLTIPILRKYGVQMVTQGFRVGGLKDLRSTRLSITSQQMMN